MKRSSIPELSKISRYQYDNIFNVYKTDNGFYYYNLYNTVQIDPDIDPIYYQEHFFSEGDYWTKLAHTYYGNQSLWWIILIANNIKNPLALPPFGTKLKILKDFVVSDILNNIINGPSSR
jgi:nucleoid-associated protein YgaU